MITGLGTGGAESQLVDLVRHSRHEHAVVALYDVGAAGERLRSLGTPVFDMRMRSNVDLVALPRLVARIAGQRPDAVHVHLYRACVYGRPAAALARVPAVLTTEHSLGDTLMEGRPLTRGVRRLYLATDRFSQRTLAVSAAVRARLIALGVEPQKIEVVPNGVDVDRFRFDAAARRSTRARLAIGDGDVVVGTVGRLVPSKGHDRVLRAARGLLVDGHARLVVVGDGPARGAISELAAHLHVKDRVHLLGARADVPDLLSAMDVFVAAPDTGEETFGLAMVEALTSGLPVVYTYCPAFDGLRSRRLLPTTQAALGTTLAVALGRAGGRRETDTLVDGFRMAQVAGRVDAIYEELRAP